MPLSSRPQARERQMQNLRRGGVAPAPTGNQRAATHRGYAEVAVARLEAKQRELVEALAADAPLRDAAGGLPRHDTVAVTMLAKSLCRLEDVERYLALRGLVDDDDSPRPAVEVERRLRLEIGDWCDALGMTPRARARLGLDLQRTVDLAQAMSQLDVEGEAHA